MWLRLAGTVNPPNLSPSLLGGQCVEHSEDRGGADADADKDHGTLALPQRKAAARGAHIENIACLNPRIDVSPGRTLRLALDADAIAILARRARQRIAAQESALVGPRPQPQYDKLPGQGGGQRLTVGWLQDERCDIAAFAQLMRYPQGAEALPRRGRALRWAEPGVAGCSAAFSFPVEQRLQRGSPADAQCRDTQRSFQPARRVTRQIQQRIDLGDGHLLGTCLELHDFVARADFAFLQD